MDFSKKRFPACGKGCGILVERAEESMRKTKLVITMGPALMQDGFLREALRIADAVRINASHSNPGERTPVLEMIRQTAEAVGRRIPVFLDLQGPKWRIGRME